MLLGNYFDGIHKNYKKLFFSGISFNTRSLKKNNIFFAIKGNSIDGNKFISKAIEKGSKIIEYKGKVITRREAEENPKYDNDKAIYLFNLNKKYDLDGDFKFNTARLINHSCDPNCEVTGTGLKVWVYAIKDIKKAVASAIRVYRCACNLL